MVEETHGPGSLWVGTGNPPIFLTAASQLRRQKEDRVIRREIRLAAAVSLVLWVVLAFGQEIRSVRGRVLDQNGHALAGAVVQIQDRTTLRIRSYVTEADGSYHFADLYGDLSYHLQAKYSGVSSRSKILSKYDSDREAVIDLKIDMSK